MEDIFAAHEQAQNNNAEQRKRERHHRRALTESSGDEDRPLEMSGIRSPVGLAREKAEVNGRRGRGRARREEKRQRSMVSLASEEDLLGRRMKGLAGGLMGEGVDGEETP